MSGFYFLSAVARIDDADIIRVWPCSLFVKGIILLLAAALCWTGDGWQ